MDFVLVRRNHLDARHLHKGWVQILKRRMFFSTQASSRTPHLAPVILTSSPAVAVFPGDHRRPAACAKGCIISGKDRSSTGNFSPPLAVCAISFPLSSSSFVPSGLTPYTCSPVLLSPSPPPSPPYLPLIPPLSLTLVLVLPPVPAATSFFKLGIRCVYIKFAASGKLQLPHFFILLLYFETLYLSSASFFSLCICVTEVRASVSRVAPQRRRKVHLYNWDDVS